AAAELGIHVVRVVRLFPETRLYNWTPELEAEAARSLPEQMPERLQELLRNETGVPQSTPPAAGGATP
ncbi:MAG: hypothetical protein LDL30_13980, partial [Desulfovibrio sp.]|nr:hypothetical protein [Desulfovibrio sp.]